MTTETLITLLQYLSQSRRQLPLDLEEMTKRLAAIQQQIHQISEDNKLKQAEIFKLLQLFQEKLNTLPQRINQLQTPLQQKIVTVAGKLKRLDGMMAKQQEEMSPLINSVNQYFQRFENQLQTIHSQHLQLLDEILGVFNQLWQTVENNYNRLRLAWQKIQGETETLQQEILVFQQATQSHFQTIDDGIQQLQEVIDFSLEEEIFQTINQIQENLEEEIEDSLGEIENTIQQLREENQQIVSSLQESVKNTVDDFADSISQLLSLEESHQEVENCHQSFYQTAKELEFLLPSIRQLITDLEKAKESLNI